MDQSTFEDIRFFRDETLGLSAIIAVHSTIRGPALGGCRCKTYPDMDAALNDVLRLAEGMTYKSAVANLPLGGGKSVLVPDSEDFNRRDIFLRFGEWVDQLQGSYIAAEDMGTSVDDVSIMGERTQFVSGKDPKKGGAGDPSPHTARGVYLSMKEGAQRVFGTKSLAGKTVLIQGVGQVGRFLLDHVLAEGAQVLVSDTREAQIAEATRREGVKVVDIEDVIETEMDIFAPCAVGGVLNENSIPKLKCRLVAGAANNQLGKVEDEKLLHDRDILYLPDYVINSGGVIMCAEEVDTGGYSEERVVRRVDAIADTISLILDRFQSSHLLPGELAHELAKERLQQAD